MHDARIECFHHKPREKGHAQNHAIAVEMLHQVGAFVEEEVIERTEGFSREEHDHSPAQGDNIRSRLSANPENEHQRERHVKRLNAKGCEDGGPLFV